MSNLRRYYENEYTYFVTRVTYARMPVLIEYENELWEAFNFVKNQISFELKAWVIISDHFHLIIRPFESNLSEIMKRIKLKFAGSYRSINGLRSGRIWQNRFWDHVIRDQRDMNRHINYIHYNPVKHGLVKSPFGYKNTSIHKYLKDGFYPADWGVKKSMDLKGEFGE